MRRHGVWRRRRVSAASVLMVVAMVAGIGLLILNLRAVDDDPATSHEFHAEIHDSVLDSDSDLESESGGGVRVESETLGGESKRESSTCATVEEMGKELEGGFWNESFRVRKLIQHHFELNGAPRVRNLSPEQFCQHGFVLGKSAEAGFGNEMYKILSGAALSVMLNRSLIIGQTRGKYPFGDYIAYSNLSFTMNEIKHLWRLNKCEKKYKRQLIMRTDDFEKPMKTNVLCSNWRKWKQPIIWFQGTNDAVATQFFLKNIHPEMSNAASNLFGKPEVLHSRPNVFGELMRVLISPSEDVEEAVNWVLGGVDPDISLHMRMLMNRSVRAAQAALNCIRKAMLNLGESPRPKVVIVSDTPSLIKNITPNISKIAEVIHFDYELFKGHISDGGKGLQSLEFRAKDWGPAPRWVAFVDFFLASRAKHAVVSGAHRRVGTTYAQLIAALAAANNLGDSPTGSNFSFFSSFQSDLLRDGLRFQTGWGHVWNRFAGPLSCHKQHNQCAFTPLLPPAWWDGLWQSPLRRDISRLADYGIQLTGLGTINETHLQSFCSTKKVVVKTIPYIL
ncbi:uncharacterized protein LOC126800585 [Argentina anserina]|uniref:uncharacterized protein LOC126800585 n=1 Tax=Argentina anserina TaxID=57926 RepID=UPI00217688CD|nr:uncharacterized protein LOC126800585 [Potentilla anserina]